MSRILPALLFLMFTFNLNAQPPVSPEKPGEKAPKKTDAQEAFDKATPEEKAKVKADMETVAAAGGMSLLCVAGVVVLSLIVTFIPGVIATMRGHESQLAIWLVCFLLGWTGIGWIVALIWSFAATGRNSTTVIVERDRPRRSRRDDDEDDEEDDRPRRRRR